MRGRSSVCSRSNAKPDASTPLDMQGDVAADARKELRTRRSELKDIETPAKSG